MGEYNEFLNRNMPMTFYFFQHAHRLKPERKEPNGDLLRKYKLYKDICWDWAYSAFQTCLIFKKMKIPQKNNIIFINDQRLYKWRTIFSEKFISSDVFLQNSMDIYFENKKVGIFGTKIAENF